MRSAEFYDEIFYWYLRNRSCRVILASVSLFKTWKKPLKIKFIKSSTVNQQTMWFQPTAKIWDLQDFLISEEKLAKVLSDNRNSITAICTLFRVFLLFSCLTSPPLPFDCSLIIFYILITWLLCKVSILYGEIRSESTYLRLRYVS